MSYPDYWNQPVPARGNPDAKLVVLGLAPGKHGANRTGVPFTGDASGDLLFATLRKLSLVDHVMITNVVKCLPIKNKPSTTEINNCQRYLEVEIDSRDGLPTVFLALGRVAHNALLKVCSRLFRKVREGVRIHFHQVSSKSDHVRPKNNEKE